MITPEQQKHLSIDYLLFENDTQTNIKTVRDFYLGTKFNGNVIYIKNIVVDRHYRNNRLGGKQIHTLLEEYPTAVFIIDLKYYNTEYELNIPAEDKINSLKKLTKYFSSLGFKNMSKYFGQYKNKVSMIHFNGYNVKSH